MNDCLANKEEEDEGSGLKPRPPHAVKFHHRPQIDGKQKSRQTTGTSLKSDFTEATL